MAKLARKKVAKIFTRSNGATSGAESYGIGVLLFFLISVPVCAWRGINHPLWCTLTRVLPVMVALQMSIMKPINWKYGYYGCLSQALTPQVMRNASIGFAECVRPGGKPTSQHCLHLYHWEGWFTSLIFFPVWLCLVVFNPTISLVRLFYPEHREGVNYNRWFSLYWFFLQYPCAVQGEGPSNGDGLAMMNGGESILFPIRAETDMHCGEYMILSKKINQEGAFEMEGTKAYWKDAKEGRPRLRDMFHDKLFCYAFFEQHGTLHPTFVAEVQHHKIRIDNRKNMPEGMPLIWKPRYSTMGLGVEWFKEWKRPGLKLPETGVPEELWAPSTDPYVIEELLVSGEYHDGSEWYRMPTIWNYNEQSPKLGYIWRTRNKKGDKRVQTDIIGGVYLLPRKPDDVKDGERDYCTPYVGPCSGWDTNGHKEKDINALRGTVIDPRKYGREGYQVPIHPGVEKALQVAIKQAIEMHKTLGKALWSIGWDLLIRQKKGGATGEMEPVFIEFNINNGFFLADHSVAECRRMAEFYSDEWDKRERIQLIDYNNEELVSQS